jgi:putative protease
MMERDAMLELLAPAGSMEALRAAVQNGANAVYLGCGSFNARQGAKNFTPQMLQEAVKYCHIRGVQVHLTLNTLVSDREMSEGSALIRKAALSGVDAFIVQVLAVVQLCREIAPQVCIHGSTQMTVHSLSGVLMCAAWGMDRVVLSRELGKEDIAYIVKNSPVEIEIFAHGALCMCYSGQCYLSSAIGGRSGNRGRCAQPCRQSYGYGRWENKYPLSLKDNCLVWYLKELRELGVASLKLEGRMKRPEYVAAVTGVYRKALDEGVVTNQMLQTLSAAFNRQGFTDGYYAKNTGSHMFGIREDKYDDTKWLQQVRQSYETTENGLVGVRFQCRVTTDGSVLTVTDPEGRILALDHLHTRSRELLIELADADFAVLFEAYEHAGHGIDLLNGEADVLAIEPIRVHVVEHATLFECLGRCLVLEHVRRHVCQLRELFLGGELVVFRQRVGEAEELVAIGVSVDGPAFECLFLFGCLGLI